MVLTRPDRNKVIFKTFLREKGWYDNRKSNFNACNFSAPDKNPQNIRVQASQPKEMIIKWEVCIL